MDANGWMPISSAPRDETLFVCWVSAIRYGEDGDGQQYSVDVSDVDFGQWRTSGGYYENMMGQIGDEQVITHWQPMPGKPETADGR